MRSRWSIDALIIQVVALVTGAVVGLLVSVLHVPDTVDTIIKAVGGAVYLVWAGSYFVFFWSTTGQTTGALVMRFRVALRQDAGAALHRRGRSSASSA